MCLLTMCSFAEIGSLVDQLPWILAISGLTSQPPDSCKQAGPRKPRPRPSPCWVVVLGTTGMPPGLDKLLLGGRRRSPQALAAEQRHPGRKAWEAGSPGLRHSYEIGQDGFRAVITKPSNHLIADRAHYESMVHIKTAWFRHRQPSAKLG